MDLVAGVRKEGSRYDAAQIKPEDFTNWSAAVAETLSSGKMSKIASTEKTTSDIL